MENGIESVSLNDLYCLMAPKTEEGKPIYKFQKAANIILFIGVYKE
jgi:hypothetical protein